MKSATRIHIIYTEAEVLLSRQDFCSWREIQDAYMAYKASLGPWSVDETVAYLESEYCDLLPPARFQMDSFLAGGAEFHVLSFQRA